MAAGGFSGIVLGLATQSVLANALAGLQLVNIINVFKADRPSFTLTHVKHALGCCILHEVILKQMTMMAKLL